MSPIKKTLIVVFGGMAVIVVTTACGAMIGYLAILARAVDNLSNILVGGAIGAVVGVTIWVWLGYMVYRKKNAPPNEITPDDTTT